MINRTTKDFAAIVKNHAPNIWKTCFPKRYVPPNGYPNPSIYATSLTSCALMWGEPELTMLPHTVCALTALKQCQMGVPTYFVRSMFAQAVANTKLPMDYKLSEIKWPLNAMVFVLPFDFSIKYFGFNIPFLAVTRCNAGIYPSLDDYTWAVKHGWEIERWSPTLNENDRMLIHFPLYLKEDMPVDYSGSWPLHLDLTSIAGADFHDATTYERTLVHLPPKENPDSPTPEQEKELQTKVTTFAIKIMLAFTARPHVIKTGGVMRPAQYKVKKGVKVLWNEELHHPNTVGWDYVVQRPHPQDSTTGGTGGTRIRTQWTPGHFTHQFVGKRGDPNFVPVDSLPRKPIEGTIDWEQVKPEVQEFFWHNHELRWIDPIPPTLLMEEK